MIKGEVLYMIIVSKSVLSDAGNEYDQWKYNLVAVCKIETDKRFKHSKFKIKVSDNLNRIPVKDIAVYSYGSCEWKVGNKWYNPSTDEELAEFREVLIKELEREEKEKNQSSNDMVYQITGIVPYSGTDRHVLYTYLDKDKAEEKYSELKDEAYYLDVQLDEYEVDN